MKLTAHQTARLVAARQLRVAREALADLAHSHLLERPPYRPPLRARTMAELNQRLVTQNRARTEWASGVLAACNMVNEYRAANGEYALGDCILLKLNLINKRQVRKARPRL